MQSTESELNSSYPPQQFFQSTISQDAIVVSK